MDIYSLVRLFYFLLISSNSINHVWETFDAEPFSVVLQRLFIFQRLFILSNAANTISSILIVGNEGLQGALIEILMEEAKKSTDLEESNQTTDFWEAVPDSQRGENIFIVKFGDVETML